jgi:tetratricopeptide (TPR) repeat protein
MIRLVAAIALLAAVGSDPTPRLTYVRTLPAPHSVGSGAETVAVLYKLSDSKQVDDFLDKFIEEVNRSGSLHADDATIHGQHLLGDGSNKDAEKIVRRDHPADAYAGIREFTCGLTEREGERSTHDADGARLKQKLVWVEANCHARVDLIDGRSMLKTESFYVRGQGASSRVTELTDDEREQAVQHAARSAAIAAAEQITPRRVRESAELDASAPDFDRAYALIGSERFADARQLWEKALVREATSAALHFNLALLCDAMGDTPATQKHFAEARRLDPASTRYRRASDAFRKRMLSPAAGEKKPGL